MIITYKVLQTNQQVYFQVYTHTHPFNGRLSGTTRVSLYQKGKTSLDFTEARDSEWQWHQLCHMQVCTSLQTDNHASTPPLSFLQAGCPSCRPIKSIKALKAKFTSKFTIQQFNTLHFPWSRATGLSVSDTIQEKHTAAVASSIHQSL